MNGIIGFGPSTDDTASYVEKLYDEGAISAPVASFLFGDQSNKSMLMLGSGSEAYRKPDTNTTSPLYNSDSSIWTFGYDKLMLNKTEIGIIGTAVLNSTLAGIQL